MPAWLSRASLLQSMVSSFRLAVRLMREPRVPLLMKAILPAALLYIISPLDFIPDPLPLIGELDDVGILAVAVMGFLRLCPPQAVEFHRKAIADGHRYSPMRPTDEYIDAEYRVKGTRN